MAIAAYYRWVDAGRPYEVARPIRELVSLARQNNIPVLGVIGDTPHLQSNNPQDHTPFSVTPWPVPLPGYIVTACDLREGDWCDRFLADCRAGLYPWVKYINYRYKNYSVRRNWEPVNNSDLHFHCSARTDRLNDPLGRNPWAPTTVEDDDVVTQQQIDEIAMKAAALVQSGKWVYGFQHATGHRVQDNEPTWFRNAAQFNNEAILVKLEEISNRLSALEGK